MAYRCSTCGDLHDGLPDIGFQWPDPYFDVPGDERDARVQSNTDLCRIDNDQFFIRGLLLIPIIDHDDKFGLGVWVSQSKQNFETYIANYDTAEIGPFFGWLSNTLSFYDEDTWALKTMAHFQGNGQRPLIEPGESDHSLYFDYANGITLDRAWEMVHTNLHQESA
jgi:hypothetical protein